MGRLPERDTRVGATNSRIKWRPSNAAIAIIFILVFTVGPYLAFTKHVPFTGYGYTLNATFSNGVNISTNSPVRIAGVDVGKVISVSRDGDNTKVTFTVDGKGRPIHDDAFAEIKPRIFLEGNFFVDLKPGSPSAPEFDSGGTIPVSHTSTAIQLDQILTALQSPVRADLSRLLESYGEALTHKPSAAEDATQLPEVKGKTGAEGLNGGFKYGGEAGRYSAQVTNAFLGTSPKDLSRLVAERRPHLRRARPPRGRPAGADRQLRHLHRGARGAVAEPRDDRAAPGADGADRPQVAGQPQPHAAAAARLGDRVPACGGRAAGADLGRRTVAGAGAAAALRQGGRRRGAVARGIDAAAHRQRPRRARRTRSRRSTGSASAHSKVFVPTGNETIHDDFETGPNYREFFYYLADFAGAQQNFDGNGPYLKVQAGGGGTLAKLENPSGNLSTDKQDWAHLVEAPGGPAAAARRPAAEEAERALLDSAGARTSTERWARSARPS